MTETASDGYITQESAMDDQKTTAEEAAKKPAPDTQTHELTQAELENVAGGLPDLDAGGNAMTHGA
jgi:hypothetical protein